MYSSNDLGSLHTNFSKLSSNKHDKMIPTNPVIKVNKKGSDVNPICKPANQQKTGYCGSMKIQTKVKKKTKTTHVER